MLSGCLRQGHVVTEEGYEQYKFRRFQAKLVVNKRWSLTRVVTQEGDYCISIHLMSLY